MLLVDGDLVCILCCTNPCHVLPLCRCFHIYMILTFVTTLGTRLSSPNLLHSSARSILSHHHNCLYLFAHV